MLHDELAWYGPWTEPHELPSIGYCDSRPASRAACETRFSCPLPCLVDPGDRGFQDALGQFFVPNSRLGGGHGQKARFRHARRRIDLKHIGPPAWSDAKIDPRGAAASHDVISSQREVSKLLGECRRKRRRTQVTGLPFFVFRREIIEAVCRHNLDGREGQWHLVLAAKQGDGDLMS